MRWGLLGIRLSIVAVYLVIAVMIVMSILPLASGKIQVSVPEEGEEPTIDGSRIAMTIPVDITNDGYFDIQDLTVKLRIADGAKVLTEQSSAPVDVIAGRTNHLNLSLVLDLDAVEEDDLKDLVFNATILDLSVGVEAGYSLGLVKAAIDTTQMIEWKPMVTNLRIEADDVLWESNGTNVDVLIPYHFEASDFVQGRTVSIQAQLANSTAVVGTASESFTVGPVNDGQLRFVMPQSTYLSLQSQPETLVLGADITLMGATAHIEQPVNVGGLSA